MTFSCDLETQRHILFPIVYVDVHIKWDSLRPTRFKDVIILYDLDLDLEGFLFHFADIIKLTVWLRCMGNNYSPFMNYCIYRTT